MITYKNITEVEVVNEVPENATALINDGGELKQVACGKGFGGGGVTTAIIKRSDYDNAIAGVSSAVLVESYTYTCLNMTFNEAVQHLMSGEPLSAIILYSFDGVIVNDSKTIVGYDTTSYTVPTIMIQHSNNCIYWTANGISAEQPELTNPPA